MLKTSIISILSQTLLVLCFMATGWTSTSSTESFTLDALITIALKNNPQLEIARQQYLVQDGTLTQSKSSYLPHLTAGADLSKYHYDDLQPIDEDTVGHALFSVNQLIYDFGKTTGLINASKFSLEATKDNFSQVAFNIVYQVKARFYVVLEKQRLVTVAKEAESNYKKQLSRARQFFASRVRTRIDVTNAEVNLSNQQLNLLRASSDLKVARINLEQTLGLKPAQGSYTLVANDPKLARISAEKPPIPGKLEELLKQAKKNRPGLQLYGHLVEAAESSITHARGDYWPTVEANGDYEKYESDLPSVDDQWSVGVGLTWEFFSGFDTKGKVSKARAQLRKVKTELRNYELTVIQEVTESYLRADENRMGIDIASRGLKLANDNLELAAITYSKGSGNVTELNEAQLRYIQSQSNMVITYYDYLTALARIEQAVGVSPQLKEFDINTEMK